MVTASLYDHDYFASMRGVAPFYEHVLSLISDMPRDIAVLDVGCGRGELMQSLWRRGVRRVDGFDIAPASVALANERLAPLLAAGAAISVKEGSITDSALYEPDSFDVIFMTDIVEHLPQPVLENGLNNVRRWLKPGPSARLVVHTFPTLGLHRMFTGALKLLGKTEHYERTNAIHCNVQTRASLESNLAAARLRREKLWLSNDIVQSSNEFHHLPEGVAKNALRHILDKTLRLSVVEATVDALGLDEFARPSIYALCSKED